MSLPQEVSAAATLPCDESRVGKRISSRGSLLGQSVRLEIVDALRGIAALAVCWYHFTQNVGDFLPPGFIKASGTRGYLGVPIFFVISGFVIPYSLYRSSYRLRDYFKFVAKRLVRVDPPYFVSLALILAVGFVLMHFSNSKRGVSPFASWQQLVFHIGYLNELLGYKWLSPIYWTLAIEFQFYLLLGLVFPLFSKKRVLFFFASLFCLTGSVCHAHGLVFSYLPWFCFGIMAYAYVVGQIGFHWYLSAVGVLFAQAFYFHGPHCAIVLLVTSLVISFVRLPVGRFLSFLGTISYSIYLTHVPIGRTIIDLSDHFQPSFPGKLLVLALALGGTIFGSCLMCRFVEKPAISLASRIRYGVNARIAESSDQ